MYDQDNAAQGDTAAQHDEAMTIRGANGDKLGHIAPAGESPEEQLFSLVVDQGAARFSNLMEVSAVAAGAMVAAAQGITEPLKAREIVASVFTGIATESLSRVLASASYNMGYGIDDIDTYVDGIAKVLKANTKTHLNTILRMVAEQQSKAANAADEADENARATAGVEGDTNATAQHDV